MNVTSVNNLIEINILLVIKYYIDKIKNTPAFFIDFANGLHMNNEDS